MSVSEMPAHTHTRGTMQITGGGVQAFIWAKNSTTKYASPSGAFSLGIAGNEEYTSPTGWAANVAAAGAFMVSSNTADDLKDGSSKVVMTRTVFGYPPPPDPEKIRMVTTDRVIYG